MYYLYILKCNDESLYTGITTDLQRRIFEHNNLDVGAKYTKARRPCKLVYFEELLDRSLATKREIEVKKLTKQNKIKLIKSKQL